MLKSGARHKPSSWRAMDFMGRTRTKVLCTKLNRQEVLPFVHVKKLLSSFLFLVFIVIVMFLNFPFDLSFLYSSYCLSFFFFFFGFSDLPTHNQKYIFWVFWHSFSNSSWNPPPPLRKKQVKCDRPLLLSPVAYFRKIKLESCGVEGAWVVMPSSVWVVWWCFPALSVWAARLASPLGWHCSFTLSVWGVLSPLYPSVVVSSFFLRGGAVPPFS